jgi:hypothetical protein
MSLAESFKEGGYQRALAGYAGFARAGAWSIEHKLDLYVLADRAFGPLGSDSERYEAFAEVYRNLRGYWQVFRGAKERWECAPLFDVLRSLDGVARSTGVSLSSLKVAIQSVRAAVTALREIKRTKSGDFPIMTASKFLHFFNPRLFPIFDTQVIWNRVFRQFRADWRRFCSSAQISRDAEGVDWYLGYMQWGESLLCTASPALFSYFSDWYKLQVPQPRSAEIDHLDLSSYLAAIFEFTIIGAAVGADPVEGAGRALPGRIAIEVAEELLADHWSSGEAFVRELRLAAAAHWLSQGRLGLGAAARIAGVSEGSLQAYLESQDGR